jgi:hypothetical protein
MFLPAEFERFRNAVPPEDRDGDLIEAYHRLLQDPDAEVRRAAAAAFHEWEWNSVSADADKAPPTSWFDARFQLARARIVTHYVRENCWLHDDTVLGNAHALAGIPGVVITGRLDLGAPRPGRVGAHTSVVQRRTRRRTQRWALRWRHRHVPGDSHSDRSLRRRRMSHAARTSAGTSPAEPWRARVKYRRVRRSTVSSCEVLGHGHIAPCHIDDGSKAFLGDRGPDGGQELVVLGGGPIAEETLLQLGRHADSGVTDERVDLAHGVAADDQHDRRLLDPLGDLHGERLMSGQLRAMPTKRLIYFVAGLAEHVAGGDRQILRIRCGQSAVLRFAW